MSTRIETQMPDPTDGIEELGEAEEPPGIAVLYSAVDGIARGEAHDIVADLEVAQTAAAIATGLRRRGHTAVVMPVQRHPEPVLRGLDHGQTLIFNLVENLAGRPAGEAEFARTLARMGFCFTGAPAATLALCLDKGRTKARLAAKGVPTAPYQLVRGSPSTGDDWLRVPLPAIVKPVAEDASHGIHRDSVVHTVAEARRQVEYILDTYHQPALVEMFLDGREFNIGVWGTTMSPAGLQGLHVLPLAELDFSRWTDPSSRVCHFEAKWAEDSPEYSTMPVLCPAEVEPDLADWLRQIALRAYLVTGCRDYARIDLRLSAGRPYVLEVNPNPCLAADAGFFRAIQSAGYDYGQMAERIATWAWSRSTYDQRANQRARGQPGRVRGWRAVRTIALAGSG